MAFSQVKFFLLFCFFSSEVRAELVKYDLLNGKKIEFAPKEVCEKLGVLDSVLTSFPDNNSINCTGKQFVILDFCHQQSIEKLARGYYQQDIDKVICQSAMRVNIEMKCESSCGESKKACLDLKLIFARDLDLIYFHTVGKRLFCHFIHHEYLDHQKLEKSLIK